jgi:signal transduction histidine kinase
MVDWLFKKCGPHYLLVMMIVTRLVGGTCGGLVICYVNFSLPLPPPLKHHFDVVAATVVVITLALTVLLALWETRDLRYTLSRLSCGQPLDVDRAINAGRESVTFPGRHHFHEAILVPLTSCLPLCLFLAIVDRASAELLVQVVMAAFMGTAVVLMSTFFLSERWMAPVTRHLLAAGVPVPFDTMPVSKLRVRTNICFSITIVVVVMLIGALANRRAADIVNNPAEQAEAVNSLRRHTLFLLLASIATGFMFSRLLANSIALRVADLVEAMKRVQQGELTRRLCPTGNDEIDVLGRQFNAMVEQLAANDFTIRDLNATLERKVRNRTRQLSKSRRRLKRSLKKVREHDRLKTEFVSNLSHELRTPLTMILAPLERILTRGAETLPRDVVHTLKMVRVSGQRLLELINRLLDFSKLEAGRMRLNLEAMDVNALITELAAVAAPLAEQRGIHIELDLDPLLPSFGGDPDKIDSVLSNLLSNAIKFTPAGGTIRAETLLAVDRVWVAVADTGVGIDPSQHARIFDRFVQVDGSSSREFTGTGLGLALAKELVELHGGQICVTSAPGEGSRFWFDLPLTPVPDNRAADQAGPRAHVGRFADLETMPVPQSEPENGRPAEGAQSTVLVVDDTPEVRMLVGSILRDEGYRLLFAEHGAQGLEMLAGELPDLILSDVMMPQLNGYEFCRRVKDDPRTCHIPFIMLTAKAQLEMKIEGLECGADDYVTKPFDEQQLKSRVASLLKLQRLHQDLDQRSHELRLAQRNLAHVQGQLVQAEKMGAVGQLMAGLVHEIHHSINAVCDGIQPLAQSAHRLAGLWTPSNDPAADAEIERLFRKVCALATVIENGAARTASIIRDLKALAQPGDEDMIDFDLHEALEMCLNLLANRLKHRIVVHKDYGDVDVAHGLAGQLNLVFMTILTGAQQAISGEGEIFIATRQLDGRVTVTIRDTGVDIPVDVQARIFDPFFSTNEPGARAGLALSYGIISKLGGGIECRSQPGSGAEFSITFPLRATPIGAELVDAQTG